VNEAARFLQQEIRVSLRQSSRAVCVTLFFMVASCAVPDPGSLDGGLRESATRPTLPKPPPKPAPETVDPPPSSANRTSGGVAWKRLREPTGTTTPMPDDVVAILSTGWSSDGRELETTGDDEAGLRALRVREAMPGWREMLVQMRVGERRRVWIPERLAAKDLPRGTSLYEIELLAIRPKLTAREPNP
jgi:hypothetical protein